MAFRSHQTNVICAAAATVAAVAAFTGALAFAAWSEPTGAPGTGSVTAPLNTGATGQAKAGGLQLNASGQAENGLIVSGDALHGRVGIGTLNPQEKLHVVGDVIIDGGLLHIGNLATDPQSAGAGSLYYNTSANEYRLFDGASWNNFDNGDWIRSGNNLYASVPGNVGIGTSAPQAKLHILTPLLYGLYIESSADAGTGLFAQATGKSGVAVLAESTSGSPATGIRASGFNDSGLVAEVHAPGSTAVKAIVSGNGNGTAAFRGSTGSPSNAKSNTAILLENESLNGTALLGSLSGSNATGIRASANVGNQVIGQTYPNARGYGLYGGGGTYGIYTEGTTHGLWVQEFSDPLSLGGHFAGYFEGDVHVQGTLTVSGSKQFRIAHPSDPSKYLVHASLEGPENAVFYRGEGQLENGAAVVELPNYFEALTREEGRTVLLAPLGAPADDIAVKPLTSGALVANGRFTVYSNNPVSSQRFSWEVKAVRADISPLTVSMLKTDD